jgi:mono/diheme cytochrome c family protein
MPSLPRHALLVIATCVVWALTAACKPPSRARPAPEKAKAAATLAGHPSSTPPALPPFEVGSVANGKELVAQFECNRCHEGTGLAQPKLERDCVRCHEQIATDEFQATPAKLAQWKPHVMAYRDVPSLSALGRLRPAWVMAYLLEPRDLRPSLAQTMPRLDLSTEQARDIATYLTRAAGAVPAAPVEVTPDAAQVARGKQLMTERACTSCHQMTGSGLALPAKVEPAPRTLGLAPDLRFARERAEPAAILQWLLDPTRVKHDSAMPNLTLSAPDARDLAAYVSFARLEAAPVPSTPARLPVLTRRVGFDEVNDRVFSVTCRHCHTNPDSAGGDGGPGNTGGFGFKPRKIDFSSYQGIASGGVDAKGERVSLFAPTKDGLPRLVAALVARQREELGQVYDGVRGMPLGLPPLAAEQIQLVESWVEQGRPL